MIFLNLIKAFAVGICASAPIGPVAIFVMQKSLNYGRKAGFTAGVGSALMDTTYAALSVLALAVAQKFIESNELLIALVGGAVITVIGAMMAVKDPMKGKTGEVQESDDGYTVGYAAQTFLMALSNPAALLVMFGLVSAFGLETEGWMKLPVLLMVFAGAVTYWFVFSWVFSHLKRAVNYKALSIFGRVAGLVIAAFGIVLIIKGLKLI